MVEEEFYRWVLTGNQCDPAIGTPGRDCNRHAFPRDLRSRKCYAVVGGILFPSQCSRLNHQLWK